MRFNLENLVRENIGRLRPYSSARSEFAGEAEVFLDANENPFGSPAGEGCNRYPDPEQRELKSRIAEIFKTTAENIFIGNGSDEAIDLLFRIFCEPGRDECIICPPTYGMYRVSADINCIGVKEVSLKSDFQLDKEAVLNAVSDRTKLIFICSPNNPTGNLMKREDIRAISGAFKGIVVVDEAYADFSNNSSLLTELDSLPNVVILKTFSKAWGMAGLRVGMGFAATPIIGLMNRVKPPYNISGLAQNAVIDALECRTTVNEWIKLLIQERENLSVSLAKLPITKKVFPSDANFLLVRFDDPESVYRHLLDEKIVVRDRSRVPLCEGCLRITVGTKEENAKLLESLRRIAAEI